METKERYSKIYTFEIQIKTDNHKFNDSWSSSRENNSKHSHISSVILKHPSPHFVSHPSTPSISLFSQRDAIVS